jgi:16S rRNA (cytosine967-C5)-methyltransferase
VKTDAELRLTTVPWSALAGLGPTLAAPLADILAGQPAERVLDKLLRANRHFTPEQRAVTAESLFGVGLWRRRLRAHLPTGMPLQWLAILARELGGHLDAPALLDVTLPELSPTPTDWRDLHSIPDWIAAHFERRFGSTAPALAAALNRPGPVCLRARGDRTELATRLAAHGITTTPGRWSAQSLIVTTPRPNLLGLGPTFLGTYEVQDEGSQILGALVDVHPGDDVLDLCAGAGGKSLQLASLVGPQGRVHATDVDLERLERLRTRASKANARVLIHGRQAPASLRVPRVLVDAPCSELGALRRGPDLRWRLDPQLVSTLPALQRELIETGLQHLTPDGKLVYATCTLTLEENEAVVDAVLAAHPELTLVRPQLPAALLDARGLLLLAPHLHGTDGFFGAVFTRRQGDASSPPAVT